MSEGGNKHVYRVYRVEEDGHIYVPPVEFSCDDDADAIEHTKQLLDGSDLELWNMSRLVVRLNHTWRRHGTSTRLPSTDEERADRAPGASNEQR